MGKIVFMLPPLERLSNGVLIPTEKLIFKIHDLIIDYRKELGKDDPDTTRDDYPIRYLVDLLRDKPYKYKKDYLENALYVSTECFYQIACQHPFTDGNKSTGYLTALFVLQTNLVANNSDKLISPPNSTIFAQAPKEVGEIVKLADTGNKEEAELKRLIKVFLQNKITGVQNEGK